MQLGYRLTNSLGKPSKCPGLHHWVLWVTLPPSPSQTAATCPPPLPAALLVLLVLLFVLKQIITMLMLSAPSSPSHLEPLFYLKATFLLLPPSLLHLLRWETIYAWLQNVTHRPFPVPSSSFSSPRGFLSVRNDKDFCSMSHFTNENRRDQY